MTHINTGPTGHLGGTCNLNCKPGIYVNLTCKTHNPELNSLSLSVKKIITILDEAER